MGSKGWVFRKDLKIAPSLRKDFLVFRHFFFEAKTLGRLGDLEEKRFGEVSNILPPKVSLDDALRRVRVKIQLTYVHLLTPIRVPHWKRTQFHFFNPIFPPFSNVVEACKICQTEGIHPAMAVCLESTTTMLFLLVDRWWGNQRWVFSSTISSFGGRSLVVFWISGRYGYLQIYFSHVWKVWRPVFIFWTISLSGLLTGKVTEICGCLAGRHAIYTHLHLYIYW